jgi:hypothetical protein
MAQKSLIFCGSMRRKCAIRSSPRADIQPSNCPDELTIAFVRHSGPAVATKLFVHARSREPLTGPISTIMTDADIERKIAEQGVA